MTKSGKQNKSNTLFPKTVLEKWRSEFPFTFSKEEQILEEYFEFNKEKFGEQSPRGKVIIESLLWRPILIKEITKNF
jgi:hypothetical protein